MKRSKPVLVIGKTGLPVESSKFSNRRLTLLHSIRKLVFPNSARFVFQFWSTGSEVMT